jgi:GNAT superfamily N-acetyltransferase
MAKDVTNGGVEIVRYSEKWLEPYVDLLENIDMRDPLYAKEPRTREQTKARVQMQIAAGSTKVHLLAVKKGRVLASARGVFIPSCGDDASRIATLVLLVAQSHRGKGLGTRLTSLTCDELRSQGMKGLEMAIMESWEDRKRFLNKLGFVPYERFYDVVLTPDMPIAERLPEVDAMIRPVRLPEDKPRILELFNGERSKDFPRECKVVLGQPAWWEIEPESSVLDPQGFLIAEDKNTGELLGFVDSYFYPGEKPCGLLSYVDVRKRFVGTPLQERLLLEVLHWLRKKGAVEIRGRIHPNYRNEAALFERAGFKAVNQAAVWRKTLI